MDEDRVVDKEQDEEYFDIDMLKQYFRFMFPSTEMYNWLTYYQPDVVQDDTNKGYSDYFYKREFSFTLDGDIYCRYNCFRNEQEFKDTLIDQRPIKIDIGAVYNMPPKNHSSIDSKAFVPQEKELVFDIDMTDYDDVRTCCEGANICEKCWKFMCIAVKVLDKALKDDFGYKQLLWVFSGRRGVHCWVGDASARKLNNEARGAIADYLSVHVGNEMTSATALIELPLHPAIERAKEIISEPFSDIMMREQNILANEKQRTKLLNMLPSGKEKEQIKDNWSNHTDYDDPENSVKLWKIFKQLLPTEASADYLASAMFTFLYPRLDANVSKGINHLLKSPFCVHPKTGKICVPFDPEKVDEFNPCKCPTLSEALKEYDVIAKGKTDQSVATIIPCLKESMSVFRKFLKGIKAEYTQICREKRAQATNGASHMEVETAF